MAGMTREDFIKSIEGPQEFRILENLVNGSDAILQIVSMTAAAFYSRDNEECATVDYNISLALMELSQRLEPIKYNKLIQSLDKLQKQTATHPSTGETLKGTLSGLICHPSDILRQKHGTSLVVTIRVRLVFDINLCRLVLIAT